MTTQTWEEFVDTHPEYLDTETFQRTQADMGTGFRARDGFIMALLVTVKRLVLNSHDHSEDRETVSSYHFERTIERLEGELRSARSDIRDLESKLNYKAEERHDHRGDYAESHHYH